MFSVTDEDRPSDAHRSGGGRAAPQSGPSPEHAAFLRGIRRSKRNVRAAQIAVVFCIGVLWEAAARLGWVDPFIVSQPTKIFGAIADLSREGTLWIHLWTTIWETVVGFLAGTALGIGTAVLLWWSPTLARVSDPYLTVLNSVPKVSLGPVFIVWIGADTSAVLAMAVAIALIVTIVMVYTAFRNVDPNLIKLLNSFGANRRQVLQKAVFPSAVPTMMAALKMNMGLSFVGVITGEFLVSKAGLGYLIVYGGQVFNLTLVMASIVLLTAVSAVMYVAVNLLEQRVLTGRD